MTIPKKVSRENEQAAFLAVRDGPTPITRTVPAGAEHAMRARLPPSAVFLIDVDNTLFDNDRMHEDVTIRLEAEFGVEGRDRYWALFEALRSELGYVDYLGALQRFRHRDESDPRLLAMSAYLLDYPFAQ